MDRPTDSPSVDRPLPHNLEAERCVLGPCLLDADAFSRCKPLEDSDFYRDAHRLIWRALERLDERGAGRDWITIKDALGEGDLERVGGPVYVMGLVDGLPHHSHVEDYAAIVREASRKRRAISAVSLVADQLLQGGEVAWEALDEVRHGVLDDAADDDEWHGLDEAQDTGGAWEAIASGLAWRRRVATIGGFAKAGKTTTLAGAAAGITYGVDWLSGDVRAPGRVLWLGAPGESPREEIRHLLVKAGLPPEPETLRRVVFQPVRQIDDVVAKLERLPIDGLELVVVDSLRGLLSASGVDENDSGAVRGILGKLAGLAERWDCAVDVVHHFRRDKEARRGDRMRGSGDILAGVDVTVEFDRTDDGASLTYSGREGAPVDDLFLDWHDGRYSVATGPSSPVGPGGGGGGSKGWTEEHREFVMAWRGEHPDGSASKCYEAMGDAGLKVRRQSFFAHFKTVPGTAGTETPAEGGSAVPVHREGTGEPTQADGTGAVPVDPVPGAVQVGASEPGGATGAGLGLRSAGGRRWTWTK